MTELIINGKPHLVDIETDTPLLWAIRDTVGLTGTKYGCGIQQCGACTVLIGKRPVRSCGITVGEVVGKDITTIEGLSKNGKLHPMQESFKKHHGLQCGFCTPGMVMSAVDLLQKNKNPSEQEIRDWLEGNICRCTGYQGIVAAVKDAASKM